MAKKINKKNYAKQLSRAGSTLAVAMAMTAVLAFPANADELEDPALQNQAPDIPPAGDVSEGTPDNVALTPVETNQNIEQSNNETVVENTQADETNQQVDQTNNNAVQDNTELSNGTLEEPDLTPPDAPEAPNTEGLDGEDYNEEINDYNTDVDDYNNQVDDYNDKVDDYNDKVDEFNQNVDTEHQTAVGDYNNAKTEHEEAEQTVKDYEQFLSQLDTMDPNSQEYADALEQFKAVDPNFEEAWAKYEDDKAKAESNHTEIQNDYSDFLTELDSLDPNSQEYADALEKFKAADPNFEEAWAKYEDDKAKAESDHTEIQNDYSDFLAQLDSLDPNSQEYADALEKFKSADPNFEEAWAKYEDDKAKAEADYAGTVKEYEDFLANLDALDPNSQEYADALEKFKAADPAFGQAWSDYETDKETADSNYTQAQEAYNQHLDALLNGDKGSEAYAAALEYFEATNPEFAAAWNKYVQDAETHEQKVTEAEIYDVVSDYNQTITNKNEDIAKDNAALEDDLHAENVDNIDAVGNINAGVQVDESVLAVLKNHEALASMQTQLLSDAAALDSHTGKGANLGSPEYAAYLAAVEAYNAKVTAHNAAVDAYNAAVNTYNAAVEAFNASQEDTSDTTTNSTTGTGTANWGNINIAGDTFSHIDVKYTAAAAKDVTVTTDENGKETTTSSANVSQYTVVGVYTSKEAAQSKPYSYGVSYRNNANSDIQVHYIQKDNANNEFGNPSHSGANLDPAEGEIYFYVTLQDKDGNIHGIDVTMDATSVYPEGTYYAGEDNDRLGEFVGNNGEEIPTEVFDGVTYYNISGQSVFVVSALTCDGMGTIGNHNNGYEWKYVNGRLQWVPKESGNDNTINLNPDGLDLVLNVQTLIEIHQAGNAQKVNYLGYELGKTAQAEDPGDPGKAPEAPTSDFEVTKQVVNPPEFNPTMQQVNTPEFNPTMQQVNTPEFNPIMQVVTPPKLEGPGEFTRPEPGDPVYAQRLEHLGQLTRLDNKVIIVITEPDPEPVVPVYPVVPLVLDNGDDVIIPDEEVPLADAPKTGDLTGLWAAISGLSLGGFGLVSRKRKEEE